MDIKTIFDEDGSIKENIKTIFEKFLKFGENDNDAIMVDNADWLENLNYISFLRDYGSYFSVNKLNTVL